MVLSLSAVSSGLSHLCQIINSSADGFIFLNHLPIQKWTDCKAIMHQSGNNNVAQIMANFDPKNVPIATALEAKQIVEPYTDEKMREISPGAAGVYTWVSKNRDICQSRILVTKSVVVISSSLMNLRK